MKTFTLPGLSKIFGAPKPPALPTPAPLPAPDDKAAKDAEKKAHQAALARKGFTGTRKTVGLGDVTEPTVKRPTLLGGGVS